MDTNVESGRLQTAGRGDKGLEAATGRSGRWVARLVGLLAVMAGLLGVGAGTALAGPPPPKPAWATANANLDGTVAVSWGPSVMSNNPSVTYVVEANGGELQFETKNTSLLVNNLIMGRPYTFTIVARVGGWVSEPAWAGPVRPLRPAPPVVGLTADRAHSSRGGFNVLRWERPTDWAGAQPLEIEVSARGGQQDFTKRLGTYEITWFDDHINGCAPSVTYEVRLLTRAGGPGNPTLRGEPAVVTLDTPPECAASAG